MSSLFQIWTLKSKADISEENFRNLVESISGERSTKNLSKVHLEKIVTAIYKLHPELKRKMSLIAALQLNIRPFRKTILNSNQ